MAGGGGAKHIRARRRTEDRLRERHHRQMDGQKVRGVGIHPPRFDGSVITKVFDIYMRAEEPADRPRERSPRTVDELDPETRERLKKVWEEIDKRKGD